MSLFLDDGDVRLYHGDALEQLRGLPDASVDMVATSPPFYGLRDYGSEGQIGLEETPDQWVTSLVTVFRECRRVLADHGTLWVEIGDSYCANVQGAGQPNEGHVPNAWQGRDGALRTKGPAGNTPMRHPTKQKDLLGQPWLLAFALRADGWWLRSEIIWARPNPMPESVTDRPTKAHSTVFLLSKRPRYFYDADAIREKQITEAVGMDGRTPPPNAGELKGLTRAGNRTADGWIPNGYNNPSGANARSVWTIPTEPTPFAHFATWPRKLVGRMIQAGTSERGKCPECGKPWVRDVQSESISMRPNSSSKRSNSPSALPEVFMRQGESRGQRGSMAVRRETLGWSPSCACFCDFDEAGTYPATPVPCTVLDPFAGSGTTLLVARQHGRHAIGIELNADYCRIAADRLSQLSLLTEAHQ